MDQLLQLRSLTGPPERRVPRIGLKVTTLTIVNHTPDTPTVTLMCHQHTWWVAQWDGKGTATRVQMQEPEMQTATPLALGDRFRHPTHHTNHTLAHWLAVKTAMHLAVDARATDTTVSTTWLTLARNLAGYVRSPGMTQTQRWLSWPTEEEQIFKSALTTRKPTPTRCGACTGPGKGTDRHTAPSKVATPPSRPPGQRRNRCRQSHGPDRRGRGH